MEGKKIDCKVMTLKLGSFAKTCTARKVTPIPIPVRGSVLNIMGNYLTLKYVPKQDSWFCFLSRDSKENTLKMLGESRNWFL